MHSLSFGTCHSGILRVNAKQLCTVIHSNIGQELVDKS